MSRVLRNLCSVPTHVFETLHIFAGTAICHALYSLLHDFDIPLSAVEDVFGRLNHDDIRTVSLLSSQWNSHSIDQAELIIWKQFRELGDVPLLTFGHTDGAAS